MAPGKRATAADSSNMPTSEPRLVCHCGAVIETVKTFSGADYRPSECAGCRAQAAVEDEKRRHHQEFVRRLEAAMMPSGAFPWTFESARRDAQDWAAVTAVEKWKYGKVGLFIHGPAGTGKSVLTWCLLRREIMAGKSGLFAGVPDLLTEKWKDADAWTRARTAAVTVLDDLGAERPTPWVRERLFSLINHRIENERPIIFTSNCRVIELAEHLGDPAGRIVDRIVGNCRMVEVHGESYRVRAAKERMAEDD